MKKKIIIIVGILIICLGITIYIINNSNKSTNVVTQSNNKYEKDSSGIDWSTYDSYDITLSTGNVNITKSGVYNITGTLKNGSIIVNTEDNVKIILNGVDITSNSASIYVGNAKNTYIELIGENKINSTTDDKLDAAIYSSDDLFIYGSGSIEINSNKDGISSKDDLEIISGTYNISCSEDAIKGKDSVTINNGEFTIKSKNGIKTTNEEKGELTINDGTFNMTTSSDGIESITNLTINNGKYNIETGSDDTSLSMKGIKATNELVINGGEFTIDSIDDAIHSNSNITTGNANIEISTSDDGIHADNNLNIKSGTIKIYKSHEGLEAYNITIDDGDISITANDDGINIGGGNDSSGDEFSDNGGLLTINGGKIYVNSTGDGLDSNGSIIVTGGDIYVDGPSDNGNGALDYNGEFKITGGQLIAVSSSGMAQNVSQSSTQNTIMINLSESQSGSITLGDISYTPSKNYQSILISSNKLETNKEYTLTAGNKTESVTLSSTVTSLGNNSNMMGMQPGQNGGNVSGGMNGRR